VQLITFSSLIKNTRTLDAIKTLEHWMKWKNTRSSGKTLGVVPLVWRVHCIIWEHSQLTGRGGCSLHGATVKANSKWFLSYCLTNSPFPFFSLSCYCQHICSYTFCWLLYIWSNGTCFMSLWELLSESWN